MVTPWVKKLESKLPNHLIKKYAAVFPLSYQEDFTVEQTLIDIYLIESVNSKNPLEINLYEEKRTGKDRLYLKLIQYNKPIPLSDVLPMLENMNLRTYSERPYKIVLDTKTTIWISDFSISYIHPNLNIKDVKEIFEDALIQVNAGTCENDGFNKLILGSRLPSEEVMILRAYAKYLQQIGFRFSQAYIERTLVTYPETTRDLVDLFKIRFDPEQKNRIKKSEELNKKISSNLENIRSLDEDKILRHLWLTINATLRTNYFQTNADGTSKEYFSFKLASENVPELPLPHPLYEIFVYSPRFEAIHLRSAKVARGGIRWSDRREDFRTEILGLMKAQRVKNAIIVPSGAKGGFVLKNVPPTEGVECYELFIKGLLDITDNLKNNKVIKPTDVVCYDDDDIYLVVAADKGTSTFSDIANRISQEYHFWLGDAFASGGSEGYDHKKMGITARGAWESIKRHFRNINYDIKHNDFTAIGIGDMSGDVFGNGMLYTNKIKLVAAFDHRDIFLDPTPHPEKSFQERKRLFNLPRSSWQDFNTNIISKGGGVFSRSAKTITLSAQIRKALEIEAHSLTPNELICAILKAPVDLFFNGGIGTYVKASTENNAEVGDKTNEFCRINGNELRCRIVGEGGNLGFTQLGRIEYALQGGLINTDFIDNSGGVDCSDHEVNIKILLDAAIKSKKMTAKARHKLLVKMTNQVAKLVLDDNYAQALTMGFSTEHAAKLSGLYHSYLKDLETTTAIDRSVEFLPDDKIILERKAANIGFTSPELAVLLAYSKISTKHEILKSNVPEIPFLCDYIKNAFPKILDNLFPHELYQHPLHREIIATQLSNQMINDMGITFVYRVGIETGASVADIIRAYVVASKIFNSIELQELIDSLETKISAKIQYELLHYVRNLINLATRWFLRGNRLQGDLAKTIAHYSKHVRQLEVILPNLMSGSTRAYLEALIQGFSEIGIAEKIGRRIAITRAIYTALNIIEVATLHHFDLIKTAKVYFEVGARFNLVWFRDKIGADVREGHWNTLTRITLRDELDILQRLLTVVIIKFNKKETNAKRLIDSWAVAHSPAIERWEKIMYKFLDEPNLEYSMFFIAIRELLNWVTVVDAAV